MAMFLCAFTRCRPLPAMMLLNLRSHSVFRGGRRMPSSPSLAFCLLVYILLYLIIVITIVIVFI